MNAALCATLLTIYPVILLTTLLEGRAVRKRYRKTNWYTWSVGFGVPISIASMVQMAVGTNNDGISGPAAVAAWTGFGIGLAALFVVSLLLSKSFDERDGR